MKVADRIKQIDGVDNAYWNSNTRELTVYHHSERNAMKVWVASALREADVIDSIDKITLIS